MAQRVDVANVRGKSEKKRRTSRIFSIHVDSYEHIWNNTSGNIQNAVNRRQFKFTLHNYYTDKYESCVICTNPICPDCRL